jgi:hypothetical protein
MKMLTEAEHTALVARVERHTGSLGDMAIIVWLRQQPPEGTPLYTHPDPRMADAVALLLEAETYVRHCSITPVLANRIAAFIKEPQERTRRESGAFLMADNPDDLRCAQWVIANGSAKRRDGDE